MVRMKNVDVEIYLNQFISFFDKNPNDLIDLIGDINKGVFYKKIEEQCYKNFENGDEVSLTQKQIIDIVISIKKVEQVDEKKILGVFQKTKFGMISLN
jgi:hypothetical protein